MNRHTFPLLLSALLASAAIPSAQAAGAINKCIDGAGRVTLTDQACDARTVRSSVAVPGMEDDDAGPRPRSVQPAPPAGAAPLRPARWLPAAAPHAPLGGDIATMKQARMRMMLQDTATRTRVAALDR